MLAELKSSYAFLMIGACLLGTLCFGQESPVATAGEATDAFSRSLARLVGANVQNTIAAAEVMPESKYGYRPAVETRTFGQLVAHVADSNRALCASATGKPEPFAPRTETQTRRNPMTKTALVAELRSSFAPCGDLLGSVDDEKIFEGAIFAGGTRIDGKRLPQGRMPLGALLALFASHTNLHYGNMATYLRMNGLVPPTSEDIPTKGRSR